MMMEHYTIKKDHTRHFYVQFVGTYHQFRMLYRMHFGIKLRECEICFKWGGNQITLLLVRVHMRTYAYTVYIFVICVL